jgi:hypothetical protein|tara:strand:- start:371 stop:724 length:354 start_codon:yes stop_codon:yes gene_type:complete
VEWDVNHPHPHIDCSYNFPLEREYKMTVRDHSGRTLDRNVAEQKMILHRRNTRSMPHSTEIAPPQVDNFLLCNFHGKGSLAKRNGQWMSSDRIIVPIGRLDSLPIWLDYLENHPLMN